MQHDNGTRSELQAHAETFAYFAGHTHEQRLLLLLLLLLLLKARTCDSSAMSAATSGRSGGSGQLSSARNVASQSRLRAQLAGTAVHGRKRGLRDEPSRGCTCWTSM
jgi:hypothetical protein